MNLASLLARTSLLASVALWAGCTTASPTRSVTVAVADAADRERVVATVEALARKRLFEPQSSRDFRRRDGVVLSIEADGSREVVVRLTATGESGQGDVDTVALLLRMELERIAPGRVAIVPPYP